MKPFLIILGLTLWSYSALADDCKHSRELERSVAVKNVTLISIDAGAGSLEITGEQGRTEVGIKAYLCAPDAEALQRLDVSDAIQRDTLVIATVIPDGLSWGNNSGPRIDLTVLVPSSAKLAVTDSSGRAEVENVAELDMQDSSGQLKIRGITGNLKVHDSSGSMTLRQIGGTVEITDSSGSIKVDEVGGDVVVVSDSSGSIDITDVGHDVVVRRDSSGSIEVKNVGGDFTVEKDGSGSIDYKNVVGKVTLPK